MALEPVISSVILPSSGCIILSIIVLSLTYWFGVSRYALTSHVMLPGPKPLPYVGNLLETISYGGLHKALLVYNKKYGRVYKMYLGRDPMITVADPEILKHILVTNFDKFRNRPEPIAGNPPLDKGLFGARDHAWRRVRSIATPTFSACKLKEIVPIIEEAIDHLISKFETYAKNERSVDISTPFCHFSLDVIMSAAFGLNAEIQTNPDQVLVDKAMTVFHVPPIIRAVSMFPFFRQIRKLFNLDPIQHLPYFADLAREVVALRRNCSTGRRDLMQLLLEARDESTNEVQTFTDEEVIAQCIIFLVAGSETTGASLAFTAYYLTHNPDVQEKLLREIDMAVRSRGDSSIFEFVQSIEYLSQVINEVLRLGTVGYVNVRECMETCVIKGIEFPAGVTVNIPACVIHRDPEYWPEPEKFDPDRFLPGKAEKRPAFSYLPFGLGPKQCMGIRLALLEMKMTLVAILQKYKFEMGVGTTETLEFKAGTILTSRDPICVKIVARSGDIQ